MEDVMDLLYDRLGSDDDGVETGMENDVTFLEENKGGMRVSVLCRATLKCYNVSTARRDVLSSPVLTLKTLNKIPSAICWHY